MESLLCCCHRLGKGTLPTNTASSPHSEPMGSTRQQSRDWESRQLPQHPPHPRGSCNSLAPEPSSPFRGPGCREAVLAEGGARASEGCRPECESQLCDFVAIPLPAVPPLSHSLLSVNQDKQRLLRRAFVRLIKIRCVLSATWKAPPPQLRLSQVQVLVAFLPNPHKVSQLMPLLQPPAPPFPLYPLPGWPS